MVARLRLVCTTLDNLTVTNKIKKFIIWKCFERASWDLIAYRSVAAKFTNKMHSIFAYDRCFELLQH